MPSIINFELIKYKFIAVFKEYHYDNNLELDSFI